MIRGASRGRRSLRRSQNKKPKIGRAYSLCRFSELMPRFEVLPGLLTVALLAVTPAFAWEHWGGDRGGTRFSSLARIMSANVGDLARAWEYRTGDLAAHAPAVMARTKSETTPLLVICDQNVTGGLGLHEQVC